MATTLNNANTPNRQATNAYSGSFSVMAGGSNKCVFAIITWDGDNNSASVSSVTYGGNAMTSCGTPSRKGTSGGLNMQAFYLVNPPTGSNTFAVTVSGGTPNPGEIYATMISFNGVDQATPVRTYVRDTVGDSTPNNFVSMVIASNANDITVSAISDDTGITGTNQTQDGSDTSGVSEFYYDHCTTPASSITHTWSLASSAVQYVMVGFSVQAASGAFVYQQLEPISQPLTRSPHGVLV